MGIDAPQWLLPAYLRSVKAVGGTASVEAIREAGERLVVMWSSPDRRFHNFIFKYRIYNFYIFHINRCGAHIQRYGDVYYGSDNRWGNIVLQRQVHLGSYHHAAFYGT